MTEPIPRTLGSIISIVKGKKHKVSDSPSANAKRIIGIDDLRNDHLIRYTEDANGTEAISDDVLIAWDGANAGTIGYGKYGYIGSTIARLRVKADIPVFTPFLGMYLKSKFDYFRQTATGATIPHINRKALERIPLPAIEFNDQIRIAYLLAKVEALVAQRNQDLQELDVLLKSVFLDMFGDPIQNERGWEKIRFGHLLADIESGKSPKCEARRASDGEWGVLKLGAITKCSYNDQENKALPKSVQPVVRHEVQTGDLLFSRKNTYSLVAACAYVYASKPKLLLPDLIFRFVFRDDALINPIYMWKLLTAETQRRAIQSLASGAAGSMPNISKTNLKEVLLPIPPLPLQEKFSVIVEKIEALKSRYQQCLHDLETLYSSISQQAFMGEMDLSCMPLPDTKLKEEKSEGIESLAGSVEPNLAINLPSTHNFLVALEDADAREELILEWLEAYRRQLNGSPFSVQKFLLAAQIRLAELHPDTDFELGANNYDQIKTWVFEALANGTLLTQMFDDARNCMQLKAVSP